QGREELPFGPGGLRTIPNKRALPDAEPSDAALRDDTGDVDDHQVHFGGEDLARLGQDLIGLKRGVALAKRRQESRRDRWEGPAGGSQRRLARSLPDGGHQDPASGGARLDAHDPAGGSEPTRLLPLE